MKQVVNREDPSKQMYAMKIIKKAKLKKTRLSKDKTAFDNIEMEVAIMKKLNHSNVVKLLEVIDDPDCEKLYLVMELMAGGSVADLLNERRKECLMQDMSIEESGYEQNKGGLSMMECHAYFLQLLMGLEYCHHCAQPPIIHRDIKPANLLLDRFHKVLKIADFGVARILENSRQELSATVGSNYYMAPEVLRGTRYKGKPSDIWACGVTLFEMATGGVPFTASNIPDLYRRIQVDEWV